MTREKAIEIIEEIFCTDQYGIKDTLTDEQTEALFYALRCLKVQEYSLCSIINNK